MPGVGVVLRYDTIDVDEAVPSDAVPVPAVAVEVTSVALIEVAVAADCEDTTEETEAASVALVRLNPSG